MTTAPSGRQTLPVIPGDVTASPSGPGALQGQAWLTLQTHHAQRLLRGRPAAAGKPAIIGLFGFAERLRGSIAEVDPHIGRGLTISAGIATFGEHANDPEELVARADAALYAAKENGRNRVELAPPYLDIDDDAALGT